MAHRTCRGSDGRFSAVPERQVPLPRQQSILFIQPDVRRVIDADYLRTCGFRVLTADTTDDGFTSADEPDVIALQARARRRRDPPRRFQDIPIVRPRELLPKTDSSSSASRLACSYDVERRRTF
jgi:hypothetical protein